MGPIYAVFHERPTPPVTQVVTVTAVGPVQVRRDRDYRAANYNHVGHPLGVWLSYGAGGTFLYLTRSVPIAIPQLMDDTVFRTDRLDGKSLVDIVEARP